MFTRHYPHWPEGLPKTFPVPRESVYENLARGAAFHPERAVALGAKDSSDTSFASVEAARVVMVQDELLSARH